MAQNGVLGFGIYSFFADYGCVQADSPYKAPGYFPDADDTSRGIVKSTS